ncbi:Hpt domain-containing protein [Sansalvadorimonas sp. 2012CJ34-2]|uniref:Hpt domain-containing protein n=1 Tax=Parendozoicomonas callyspongiae TaxID=2942213 RepID=A0ABT0PGN9_9GAMM|nr:Hpt domain-containing protein [Sansalvadorimonas sp. 2012CJ34-2]MCL6270534.1 Hpt domain-containing protein [Sansalvadorimonas sp. 2012CJ34-2]
MLNLDGLKDIVGDDQALMKDMLKQFVETTQADMTHLQDAIAAGRTRDVANLAHRIKGSCFVIGATELADIAASLEADGRKDHSEMFSTLAEQMTAAFQKVVDNICAL